jgi:hypothetical protein
MKKYLVGLIEACLVAYCIFAVAVVRADAQDVAGFKAADVEAFKVLRLDGNAVRWSKPSNGGEVVLSYRVLAKPQAFATARNCRRMTAPDELLAASAVPDVAFRQELVAAFAMWEKAAGLTFREAGEAETADILIGAQADPEGWAFADVFYDAGATQTVKPISHALICLNPARRWKIGFDGDLRAYDLRYTLAHEIGHAIGLDHPSGPSQIMGYRYEERFRDLQPGDVRGAVTLYGDRDQRSVAAAPEQANSKPPLAKRGGTRAFDASTP